ncbi:MAG: hypothetical protein AMQ74_01615 [Candidatus Methanofastidiosum methylothiophilum]|uniref:Uncharacterized protein n=1 Tax=Candidatus Methanofastidiosum methylothiophilum TaxID=1705564 RepID=A0A150ITD4_9EURY|nr:MAG: hypothetical protein AMQ74_01615 [Candidatus Methanofastidiosum methylthiophilus]
MPKGKVKKAMEKRAKFIWKHNLKDKKGIPVQKKFKTEKEFQGAYVFGGYDKRRLNFREKDYIKGGYADKSKIADFDWEQLKVGAKVEREHTNNPKKAREIASDHLKEYPSYYKELTKMEKWMEIIKITKINPFLVIFLIGAISNDVYDTRI